MTKNLRERIKLKYAKVGIILFGVLEIIFAIALISALIYASSFFDKIQNYEKSINIWSQFTIVIFWIIVLIWLGIGTFQIKLWARSICLALSWISLVEGSLRICTRIVYDYFVFHFKTIYEGVLITPEAYWTELGIRIISSILLLTFPPKTDPKIC